MTSAADRRFISVRTGLRRRADLTRLALALALANGLV